MRGATQFAVIFAMSFFVSSAWACSRGFPTYRVANDFTIVVTGDGGKPINGAEVRIDRQVREPKFHFESAVRSLTDEKGEASVRGLSNGHYFVTARFADVESEQSGQLEVESSSDSSPSRISLQWPSRTIFALQNITGTIAIDKAMELAPGTVVLLVDASTGHQIGAAVTDQRGRFQFPGPPNPGLYILRISAQGIQDRTGMRLLQGDIFVKLDANANDKELPKLGLIMSSCGLSAYKDSEGKSMVIF